MLGRKLYREMGLLGCGTDCVGAGGKVTDFFGSEYFIEGHHIIATNGPLHPVFQRLLKEMPPLEM